MSIQKVGVADRGIAALLDEVAAEQKLVRIQNQSLSPEPTADKTGP